MAHFSLTIPDDGNYDDDIIMNKNTYDTFPISSRNSTPFSLDTDFDSNDDYTLYNDNGIPSEIDVINPEFKELLNYTTNIDNINNFGKQIENKKVKRTYAISLKDEHKYKGSALPVTLTYFINDNLEPNIFTKVFLYSNVDETDRQSVLNKTLSEIYYHKQFENMRNTYEMDNNNTNSSCLFKMPMLYNYGFIRDKTELLGFEQDENMEAFYIQMSVVPSDYEPASKIRNKERCEIIKNKLISISECFERNELFHNDIHRLNVFVNNNNDIFLIDFGEASHEENNVPWEWQDNFCKFIKTGGKKSKKNKKSNKPIYKSKKHIRKSKKHIRKSKKHIHKSKKHIHKSKKHIRKSKKHIHKSKKHIHKSKKHNN